MSSTLGENIRHYRRLRDMTQEELARAAGYQTKASINKIEKNQSTVPHDRLEKIANALRVPISNLLSGEIPNVPARKIHIPRTPDIVFHQENKDFIEALYSRNDKIGQAFQQFAAVVLNEEQSNALSPSESDIVNKYRRLDANSKELLHNMLNTLVQQNAPTTKSNEGEL